MLTSVKMFFTSLGKALMLPIAVLPIAGILLRVGQPDLLDIAFIATAGSAVFSNLPIIFAVGVAIGFADENHGAAALAAFVGHAIFIEGLKVLLPTANMGVLSGIMIGAIAGLLYNRFKGIELPSYLSFFAGRRFVPIITGIVCIFLALVFSIIWPPIGGLIQSIGDWVIHSGEPGLFAYGFISRMLIPLGLHHILNSLVWFQFGDYTVIENGIEVIKHGDMWRFFAGDKTAGAFMSLNFPIMMFGLPAAALAMTLLAKPNKRKLTAGIMLSAALTSFLTGITEPVEFAFLFVAFPLYVLHAILTGISAIIMDMLNIKLGFTFSAGLFDYVLNYGISTNPLMLLAVGAVYFVLYFCVFYYAIKKWDLKTPGREDDEKEAIEENTQNDDIALSYIEAMGGKDNIIKTDNCATRLRMEIKDNTKVNESRLKALGARGVMNGVSGALQVIIGAQVESLADKIKKSLK